VTPLRDSVGRLSVGVRAGERPSSLRFVLEAAFE
jgi:hypothetical protein